MILLKPDPENERLTRKVEGLNERGESQEVRVVEERALTLYLNSQEVVTAMTVGDYPDLLAVGYFRNQGMLQESDEIRGIDYDEDLGVVVVRTARETDYEERLKRKIRTSGCAEGTAFGDLMEGLESKSVSEGGSVRVEDLLVLLKNINTMPSLYLLAGGIHGCVLCEGREVLLYVEDVGRHNAVDKISGYMRMHGLSGEGKLFFTTGRLTSEMVIKTIAMGIPILVSRSGFTAYGVQIAREHGLTLIGRAKGKRFMVLSGEERVDYGG
jgi:FdhD protein